MDKGKLPALGKGGHTMNRYKCPACGGNQYTSCGTAEGCIYCGPLKLVERCEWILIDDDKGLWQCSKCGAEWVLEAGTPADNEMNYCPACGRRLEGMK